jgi:hypothetical protein
VGEEEISMSVPNLMLAEDFINAVWGILGIDPSKMPTRRMTIEADCQDAKIVTIKAEIFPDQDQVESMMAAIADRQATLPLELTWFTVPPHLIGEPADDNYAAKARAE